LAFSATVVVPEVVAPELSPVVVASPDEQPVSKATVSRRVKARVFIRRECDRKKPDSFLRIGLFDLKGLT
jgi:hypothetical protein